MHRACTIIIALVATAALSLSTSASAATYCVAPESSCPAGQTFSSFQSALDQASSDLADDKILLGTGTYTAGGNTGFHYNQGSGKIEIAGKGATTVLTGPPDATYVLNVITAGAGSKIQGVRVHVPASAQAGLTALQSAADVSSVTVDADPSQSQLHEGIVLLGGADLTHATVTLDNTGAFLTKGVNVIDPGSTVTDTSVTAIIGFADGAASGTVFDRVSALSRSSGLEMDGTGAIRNCVVRISGAGSSSAIYVAAPGVTVTNCTLAAPAGNSATAIYVTGGGGSPVGANVSDTAMRGFQNALFRHGGGSTADLTVSYSDYDPAAIIQNGAGTLTAGAGNGYHPDAGFVDEAGHDYRLRYDSPLVDAGDPAGSAGPEDVRDYQRLVDGDGTGGARLDIGAYEYPRQGPEVAIDDGPTTGGTGDQLSWTGSATDDDPGEQALLTYGWRIDGGPLQPGATLQHSFDSAGTHVLTFVASDPAGAVGTVDYPVVITAPVPPGGNGSGSGSGSGTSGSGGGASGGSPGPQAPGAQEPGSGTPGPGAAAAAADTRAPLVGSIRVKGRRLSFAVDEDATVVLTLVWSGHRAVHRTLRVTAGRHAARLPALHRGSYRVTLLATDAAGNRSRPVFRRFRRR